MISIQANWVLMPLSNEQVRLLLSMLKLRTILKQSCKIYRDNNLLLFLSECSIKHNKLDLLTMQANIVLNSKKNSMQMANKVCMLWSRRSLEDIRLRIQMQTNHSLIVWEAKLICLFNKLMWVNKWQKDNKQNKNKLKRFQSH